jgi:AcrR family transcriptional regulator
MGRPRNFTRREVLERTIPIFWKRGFADTDLQSLEKATGVNKSGLYSEFESKEELFLASLRHYLQRRPESALLSSEPLGWRNIENFLHATLSSPNGQRGCLAVNSMRELAILPSAANKAVAKSLVKIKQLLVKNVKAEQTKMSPEAVAGIVGTFFSGLCVEQNMRTSRSGSARKIRQFMHMVRQL